MSIHLCNKCTSSYVLEEVEEITVPPILPCDECGSRIEVTTYARDPRKRNEQLFSTKRDWPC